MDFKDDPNKSDVSIFFSFIVNYYSNTKHNIIISGMINQKNFLKFKEVLLHLYCKIFGPNSAFPNI